MALTPTEQAAERLAECYLEITGVRSSFSAATADVIQDEMLASAVITVGSLTAPPMIDPMVTQQLRTFTVRLYIAPIGEGVSLLDIGAEKYQLAVPFFDRVYVYFANNRGLSTEGGIVTGIDAQTALGFVGAQLHTIIDGGITATTAPGGALYWTIEFSHVIPVRLAYCVTL